MKWRGYVHFLTDIQIRKEGAKSLCEMLKVNTTITELNLWSQKMNGKRKLYKK